MQHRAKKSYGQNFLVDQNIIHKIIEAINPHKNDCLIEIGPGLGAITTHLLQQLDRLDVIELDLDVIPELKGACDFSDNLGIHTIDVLKFNFTDFASNHCSDNRLRIVGNLPYNISTPILFHILKHQSQILDCHFMLQKEVVDRICASHATSDYGRLSVMMQTYWQCTPLFYVSAQCFKPAPKVESAIIRLIPDNTYQSQITRPELYETMVRTAFSQRRKTLKNNLKNLASSELIENAGIDPSARAETLSIAQFINLYLILDSNNTE